MLNKVLIGAGIVVAGVSAVAGFIALQPDTYHVERSVTVKSSPEQIFPLLNDFHKSVAWSPWESLDPDMKKSFEGETSGVGATYAWQGNEKVGSGRQTIIESKPNELVKIKLQNFKPFEATSLTELSMTPTKGGTVVRWSLNGHKEYMEKAFCLITPMDKVIGPDFEAGLTKLKDMAEGHPSSTAQTTSTYAE